MINLRLPSLNALRAFESSSRHLNFRIAAEELGVTQGAVAQHVRGLEAGLGVKLFERLPGTLCLTSEGRSYSASIHRAFELIHESTQMVKPQKFRLSVSVVPTFATKWLIPRLSSFANSYPDIDLSIAATERVTTFHGDGIDLAVRHGRPPFGANLQVDLLCAEVFVPVCSPNLLLGVDLPLTPRDVPKFTILHDSHNAWPEYFERTMQYALSEEAKSIYFNHTELVVDSALAGLGIAIVNEAYVERELATGRLVNPFAITMPGTNGLYVIAPNKPHRPDQVAALRNWMLENAALVSN